MLPIKIISENFHHFDKSSQILDLGIWSSRNAYFLADKNFKIIGIDRDENILAKISYKNISKICADINQYLSENNIFDNILANFSLRFTGQENFLKNLQKIQNSTKIGGIHVISDFINDDSEFVKILIWRDFYWLENDELKKLYQNENWEILEYYEEKVKTKIQKKCRSFILYSSIYLCKKNKSIKIPKVGFF